MNKKEITKELKKLGLFSNESKVKEYMKLAFSKDDKEGITEGDFYLVLPNVKEIGNIITVSPQDKYDLYKFVAENTIKKQYIFNFISWHSKTIREKNTNIEVINIQEYTNLIKKSNSLLEY